MALRTFTPSGGKIFDSTDPCVGVCIGILKSDPTEKVMSYPALAGATIKALTFTGRSVASIVSYPGGIPTVKLPAYNNFSAPLVVSVWASTKQAVSPGPGITAVAENGMGLALSPQGFGLYFDYTINPGSSYQGTSITADGFRPLDAWLFPYPWGSGGSLLDRVYVLELEPGISSRMDMESWGVVVRSRYSNTGNPYPPKVHVFRRATSPIGPPFCNMKDSAGILTWDLMKPGMLRSAAEGQTSLSVPPLTQIANTSFVGVLGAMPADRSQARTEQVPTGGRIVEYVDGVPYDRGPEMKDVTTYFGEVHYWTSSGPVSGSVYVQGLMGNQRTYRMAQAGDTLPNVNYGKTHFFVNLDFLHL